MSEASSLQALIDADAIRDLARRYAHCVWQQDTDGAVSLFAPDGVMDMGDREPIVGHEAMREAYGQALAGGELRPFVHNHVIDLQGDIATGTCYLDLRANVNGVPMSGHGFYRDEYARLDEGWRFKKRTLRMLHYGPERPSE